jgi:hypothetical protein
MGLFRVPIAGRPSHLPFLVCIKFRVNSMTIVTPYTIRSVIGDVVASLMWSQFPLAISTIFSVLAPKGVMRPALGTNLRQSREESTNF